MLLKFHRRFFIQYNGVNKLRTQQSPKCNIKASITILDKGKKNEGDTYQGKSDDYRNYESFIAKGFVSPLKS